MARRIAQQADDDLLLAPFAVAIIAKGAKGVVFTLQIRTGDVVEKQSRRRRRLALRKQALFDRHLLLAEPIEIGIEVILVEAAEPQDLTAGMRPRQAYGRQAGSLVDNSGNDLPQRQLAFTPPTEGALDPQRACYLMHHLHRAVARTLLDGDFPRTWAQGREVALVAQGQPNGFNLGRGAGAMVRCLTWPWSRKDSRRRWRV